MKKLTTIIVKNGIEKEIFAIVDDETAKVLASVDEATRHQYICDEYQDYLLERKETRRHQSLDASIDNGFDFPDDSPSPDELLEIAELSNEIIDALNSVTVKQREIVIMNVIYGLGFREISRRLGLNKETVREQYLSATKKIKNILQ